jgi:chemotaxis signal transduction protein
MNNFSTVEHTAKDLRHTFDRSFVLPPASTGLEQTENLLLLRIGGEPYALRVREIDGLANDDLFAALPSDVPGLLGIGGIQGKLISVYSLAVLLGHPLEPHKGRWLALCGRESPLGLAFSDLEGYSRIPAAHVYAATHEDALSGHVREVARTADLIRGLVNIPMVTEMVQHFAARTANSPMNRSISVRK